MDTEDLIHTQNGIYSAIKNKILPIATAWMYLKCILLNEVSQKEKTSHS